MAEEPARVTDGRVDRVAEDGGEGESNGRSASPGFDNSEFEMNLLIVFLSLFSLSTEESLSTMEREQEERMKDEARAIRRLKKRREIDEVKPVRRRAQRCRQTKIRDSRHGRKV